MPSSASPLLRAELQALGEGLNAWGFPKLNNVIQRLEEAVAGAATIALSGTTYTLNTQNYVADEARMAVLVFTGSLAAPCTITTPAVTKEYLVFNRTGQNLIFKSSASGTPTTATVRSGVPTCLFCDGGSTGNWYAQDPTLDQISKAVAPVDLNGQRIVNLAAPSAGTDAMNQTAVNTAITAAVSSLSNIGAPVASYSFGNQRLSNLANGTAQTDAVNLAQLQQQIFTAAGGISAGSAVGQVPRWTGSLYAPGAVDLTNSNAITGALPFSNGGTGSTTGQGARAAIIGATTGKALNVVRVNSGATDYEVVDPTTLGASFMLKTVFTAGGTFTKDARTKWLFVEGIGGGGSGACGGGSTNAGGGCGGTYNSAFLQTSQVSATTTVTVGAGGLAVSTQSVGNPGGASSFGALLKAVGGSGGTQVGGQLTMPADPTAGTNTIAGVSGFNGTIFGSTYGCSASPNTGGAGGSTLNGGGGGGGSAGTGTSAGGVSLNHGNGGQGSAVATPGAGTAPGGGGGAAYSGASGAGARGEVRVWEFG